MTGQVLNITINKIMRASALALTIWMFIIMTLLSVVFYAYVLWTQYWRSASERQQYYLLLKSVRSRAGHDQIAHEVITGDDLLPQPETVLNLKDSFLKTDKSYPGDLPRRKPGKEMDLNPPPDLLISKITAYRSQLIVQLRKTQMENRNAIFDKLKKNLDNRYNVHFQGVRSQAPFLFSGKSVISSGKLLCQMKRTATVSMLGREDQPFVKLGLAELFPPEPLKKGFNTCAIVSSAGSLHKSFLGNEIDSHDAVLRFNNAPTLDHEQDVGSKTTFRLLNSQVVSKPEFNFLKSQLYKNVTILVWDPSEYHATLGEWFKKPEFDIFTTYWLRRKLYPNEPFYLVNPNDVWNVWDFLQSNMAGIVEHNPPSSGFLGIGIMLGLCNWVDVYEYVPSMRLTKRCHYFDVHEDLGCTFGHWHPLASEKLLTLAMNRASDVEVFSKGKVTFPGFNSLKCA